MSASDATYLSEAAFLGLDPPPAGERWELFDGELVVTPAPLPSHQDACRRLFRALDRWCGTEARGWEVYFAPLDLRVGEARLLQPDLMVFPRALTDDDHPVRLRPELLVEVLSPSTAVWDRRAKRLAYAEAGVPEVWLVDPRGTAEVWNGPGLTQHVACGPWVRSVAHPGLVVDLGS